MTSAINRARRWWSWTGRLGVRLSPANRVPDIADDLPRLDLVAVEFPSTGEGRGYSQAHPEPAGPAPPALARTAQLGKRDHEGAARLDRLAEIAPGVGDDLTPPQDVPHMRAP